MIYGTTELSFRKTAILINRNRYQEDGDGTPYRTLQDATEFEGAQILDFLKEKSDRIFDKHGFNSEGLYNGDGYIIDPQVSPAWIPTDQVIEQINELQSPFNDSDILFINTLNSPIWEFTFFNSFEISELFILYIESPTRHNTKHSGITFNVAITLQNIIFFH